MADPKNKKANTSWGRVANWYDDYLENTVDTYQRQVILPNLSRLLNLKKTEVILDLACGSGFFSRELAKSGAKIVGVDISPELIALARQKLSLNLEYQVSSAENLNAISDQVFHKAICVLAIQNIENVKGVLLEVARVLKSGGEIILVLNHPAFRVPNASGWEFDAEKNIQYRRIESYLSESKVSIAMHPGKAPEAKTVSFHRPLQYYFKLLNSAGFVVSRLEEWISHKKSESGPRAVAEDQARHEFPLFLCLQAKKL